MQDQQQINQLGSPEKSGYRDEKEERRREDAKAKRSIFPSKTKVGGIYPNMEIIKAIINAQVAVPKSNNNFLECPIIGHTFVETASLRQSSTTDKTPH